MPLYNDISVLNFNIPMVMLMLCINIIRELELQRKREELALWGKVLGYKLVRMLHYHRTFSKSHEST